MMFLASLPQDQPRGPIAAPVAGWRTQEAALLLGQAGEFRKKIDHYSFLLTDQIGKGYSSTVYRGLDDRTGQEVAIKVIELRSLRDQTSKEMLQTEIQCFQQVQHSNVLRYINSYFTANNCYIITEYCPGSDLAKLMKQKGRMPESEAAALFLQIIAGYQAFHLAGFVHRDLKPANILIGLDGGLRLADFGFSKKRTLVERENYNVGTPIYMPRQSLAANIYNEKTDTWALGITLYEMVYGVVPFRGRTEQELRTNIERGLLLFPPEVPISAELKDFLQQTLLNDSLKRMGLRQMLRHPWISKVHQTSHVGGESPEKVEQEPQLRASLPQQGVLNNRSREYFQDKENRRSVSVAQKLKLCMPRKGSQVIRSRQPLLQRDLNIHRRPEPSDYKQNKQNNKNYKANRENRENKENREYRENKENKENNEKKENKRTESCSARDTPSTQPCRKEALAQGIEKVVALINYFRLVFRILEKVRIAQEEISSQSLRQCLHRTEKALIDRLGQVFGKHLRSIEDKSNQFGLMNSQWGHFVTSERWQMYDFVIQRYKSKYGAVLSQVDRHLGTWEGSGPLVGVLGDLMRSQLDRLLLHEKCLCIEVLGLLSHLCLLDKVAGEEGWDVFTCRYSSCESILLQNYSVTAQNYKKLSNELNSTCQSFKET